MRPLTPSGNDEGAGDDGTELIRSKADAARALGRWIADPHTDPAAVDSVIAELLAASRQARARTDREQQ